MTVTIAGPADLWRAFEGAVPAGTNVQHLARIYRDRSGCGASFAVQGRNGAEGLHLWAVIGEHSREQWLRFPFTDDEMWAALESLEKAALTFDAGEQES